VNLSRPLKPLGVTRSPPLTVIANELIVAPEIPFGIGRAAELPSSLRRTPASAPPHAAHPRKQGHDDQTDR
jgi:hypothetical protein